MTATKLQAKPYRKAAQKAPEPLKARRPRPVKTVDLRLTAPEIELANHEAREKRLLVALYR
ncbi:MAG: hypothetical protein LBS60_00655 [Deltaproteobacteria bacterium]|nr:hypothetical protein [Deltaproteobacteria bacterium]